MKIDYAAILLIDKAVSLDVAATCNLDKGKAALSELPAKMHNRWGHAVAQRQPEDTVYRVLVPLFIPRLQKDELIGLLALGPRERGRGYSRDDIKGLEEFGGEAGKAIYATQVNAKHK
ncbi:MAG: GAF domain-containing protein [Chloroflexi bacterium]|nr:GAF domain-containing protein [Chloroflexota bacterium]